MKSSFFGLRSSVFGLRSSVFALSTPNNLRRTKTPTWNLEICPEMHVNEIHLPHNSRHHKVHVLINEIPPKHTNYIKCEVYENV